jgi:hypothetical protein
MLLPSSLALCPIKTTWGIWLSINANKALYCQHPVINADEPLTPTLDNAKYFGMDMPKQDSDFGTVTCHGSCYIMQIKRCSLLAF